MTGRLVVGRCEAGRVDETTRRLVTAAAASGRPVSLGIFINGSAEVGGTAIAGIDRIVGIQLPEVDAGHDVPAHALAMLVDRTAASAVLMSFTTEATALGAGLAQSRDLGFASDVVALNRDDDGAIVVTRPIYGGKAHLRLRLPADRRAVLLLRSGRWAPAATVEHEPPLEIIEASGQAPSRIRRLQLIDRPAEEQPLKAAELIVAVGRGVGAADHINTFAAVARGFDASLAASRPVVDVGLLPATHLVGQSGTTVQPKLYVAFGISGALQHLAGIRDGAVIIAVNTDRDAPIFDVARYGACADAVEVARHLRSLLPS